MAGTACKVQLPETVRLPPLLLSLSYCYSPALFRQKEMDTALGMVLQAESLSSQVLNDRDLSQAATNICANLQSETQSQVQTPAQKLNSNPVTAPIPPDQDAAKVFHRFSPCKKRLVAFTWAWVYSQSASIDSRITGHTDV